MLGQKAPQSLAFGQLGSIFINDTSVHTGIWGRIQCVGACAFTTLVSSTLTGTLNGALTLT
jgi:hypothetical protein